MDILKTLFGLEFVNNWTAIFLAGHMIFDSISVVRYWWHDAGKDSEEFLWIVSILRDFRSQYELLRQDLVSYEWLLTKI